VVRRVASARPDFFFVQIGANDGVIYDPISAYVRRYQWSGLLVEPVATYFERLKENYRGYLGLSFENAAISDTEGERAFYRIREDLDYLPAWCAGLGTFYLDVLLTHRWAIPNLDAYVLEERVRCISLGQLLAKHGVRRIDLLAIDTEGYDYELIKQVDFDRMRPAMLLYEHQYIREADRKACEAMLRRQGYTLSRHLGNTFAFLPP
jgi:FkbM family methyltransferase